MKQEEIQERYLKIGFWFETTMGILKEKDLVEPQFALEYSQRFYNLLGTEKEKFLIRTGSLKKLYSIASADWGMQGDLSRLRRSPGNTPRTLPVMSYKAGCAAKTPWAFFGLGS